MYGSKYDTPFWKAAKGIKIEDPYFESMLTFAQQHSQIELIGDSGKVGQGVYGQWEAWNFKYWYDGMTKEKNEEK